MLRCFVVTLCFLAVVRADDQARVQLMRYLDAIGQARLAERTHEIERIRSRADADRRKAAVRARILRLMGGLPERHGTVPVKAFGNVGAESFRIEKLAYQSLPEFWVTANVYVPAGAGPFPAVLLVPGHGPTGKLGEYSWGANLARAGILAMAIDPLGQGERLQYYSAESKKSIVGGPTGEHGEANVAPLLIGESVARYMVNDSMRAVDYLSARKDVDAARIGAFGCSGGGTMTAYLAALDDRVKVAATACYITSFQELLPSATGVQEAEQSMPGFLAEGLDLPDWVELAAPKPYAIVSTTEDMFPFAGARRAYEEAKRIYSLYDQEARLHFITGPGRHGNLTPIGSEILSFLVENLGGKMPVSYTALRPERPEDLICTPTGQVATSLGGETVYSLNRKRAPRTQGKIDVRGMIGAAAQPGAAAPAVQVNGSESHSGYKVEKLTIQSEPQITVTCAYGVPDSGTALPAVLILDSKPEERFAAGGDADRLMQSGHIVLVLEPRPSPPGTEQLKSSYLGPYNLISLRATLVGKTIVGMRADDAIRALDWLSTRKLVDASAITIWGHGPLGMVALHMAALDSRVKRVILEDTLASYRLIVDQPLHRNAPEVLIPGVLRAYDVSSLISTIARPVTIVNPRDALGELLPEAEAARLLKAGGLVRMVSRAPGDALAIQ